MPFLGQDWRSPGWRWVKTEDGWKRCEPFSPALEDENNQMNDISHTVIITGDDEEIYNTEDCELAAKKRKKDHFRNNTDSQCFYREKWIYVHKESTKERHGYCTLGEAFNRLDFSSAIQDIRRFNYVVKVSSLFYIHVLKSHLLIYLFELFLFDLFCFPVMEDQYNPRLIKDLLQDLSSTLCILIRGVGKSVLVGNINIWICRLETIILWQQQLKNLQMNKLFLVGWLRDLSNSNVFPALCLLSSPCSLSLPGQKKTPKKQKREKRNLEFGLVPFLETVFCRHLIPSEEGHIDWKLMYFALQKYYPVKEQYGDTLHFCRHCSILFWKDTGHPCTASDPDTCLMPVSPQHFIDLFKF
ncbi:FBX25 protein, partial [Alcedo cyanopectus]|nr:FBX25 protein [Ceyx cyanopectus]